MKRRITISLLMVLLIFPTMLAQKNSSVDKNWQEGKIRESLFKSHALDYTCSSKDLFSFEKKSVFELKYKIPDNISKATASLIDDEDYIPWESTKHFWIGVGEMAILEFIPWALARWIRPWEDPADNWAIVSAESWWQNISQGWVYDGDNFTTNNFAHPYHGSLFFNAGRTNGYDFWESTAWSLTGSAIWEFFGETFRPAFNDWIYTGIGGSNLGEMMYRLSSMVTDNRASGSDRVWSEIFGTLINPVRGFNRAISGEMGRDFPNPEWSRPDDFLISFDAGTRSVDLKGIEDLREKEIQGLFGFDLVYGNKMKAKKPFDFFAMRMAVSSALPHFTTLTSTGYLFGWDIEKRKHDIGVTLDFTYNNLLRETYSEEDTTYTGFIYGGVIIHPYLLSVFPIGTKTNIVTQVGLNGVLMGATPDDYYIDVEGRTYDFGPGVGLRLSAAIRNGIWNYIKIFYHGNWFWTQSEPSDSKHHVHWLWLEAQYPITEYFSFGIAAGAFWRNSYYDDLPDQERPDVFRSHPVARLFFRTAIIDL